VFDQRSILIFAVVGLFQPGLTRLLSYKGIDALGVAITDPIRATTPLFSAMMAIVFLGEKLTLPIMVATLMIIAGIILLSCRNSAINSQVRRSFCGTRSQHRHWRALLKSFARSVWPRFPIRFLRP